MTRNPSHYYAEQTQSNSSNRNDRTCTILHIEHTRTQVNRRSQVFIIGWNGIIISNCLWQQHGKLDYSTHHIIVFTGAPQCNHQTSLWSAKAEEANQGIPMQYLMISYLAASSCVFRVWISCRIPESSRPAGRMRSQPEDGHRETQLRHDVFLHLHDQWKGILDWPLSHNYFTETWRVRVLPYRAYSLDLMFLRFEWRAHPEFVWKCPGQYGVTTTFWSYECSVPCALKANVPCSIATSLAYGIEMEQVHGYLTPFPNSDLICDRPWLCQLHIWKLWPDKDMSENCHQKPMHLQQLSDGWSTTVEIGTLIHYASYQCQFEAFLFRAAKGRSDVPANQRRRERIDDK